MYTICGLGIIILVVFMLSSDYRNSTVPITSTVTTPDNFPSLLLPLKYFPKNNIVGGSVDTSKKYTDAAFENGDVTYTNASLDSKDNAQTYPTTTISFSDYSTTIKSLPPVQTLSDILKQDGSNGQFTDLYKQNITQYGDLATRYLASGNFIGNETSFSVTGDGTKATIVTLCAVGSADGFCGEAQIIKDGKVIFDAQSDYVGILPSDTGNGFYVKSENDGLEPSRADTLGYVKTRFVYENGTFRPIYEQNVYYLNVKTPP